MVKLFLETSKYFINTETSKSERRLDETEQKPKNDKNLDISRWVEFRKKKRFKSVSKNFVFGVSKFFDGFFINKLIFVFEEDKI